MAKKEEREFKKINPFTASLEELEEALRLAEADRDTCSGRRCENCASHPGNVLAECFGVRFEGTGCGIVRAMFAALIAQKKQNSEERREIPNRSCSPCSGCCENCKLLDSELLKKSGYRFCSHWHNFTISEGFCYAYEGVEKPSETVDN